MGPAQMAAAIEKDLQNKQKGFGRLLSDKELVQRIFAEKLTNNDIKQLTALPYHVYAYRYGTLIFWNNNKTLESCNNGSYTTKSQVLFNERGVYIKQCIIPEGKDKNMLLTVLFPVVKNFPFENKYLVSHFEAGNHVPMSTRILSNPVKGGYAVKDVSGADVFYLKFNSADLSVWMPDTPMLGLMLAAMLSSIIWLQLISIGLSRRRSHILGLAMTIAIVVGLRLLSYTTGLPFNLESMPVFDSRLYASSAFLKSLGDLLLNALCLLWIIAFLLGNIPFTKPIYDKLPKWLRNILAVGISIAILICSFGFINVISSLVLDSNISFDVIHFYTINKYTIYGLFTIGIITLSCCLVIYLLNTQLTAVVPLRWMKYALLVIVGIILITLSDTSRTGNLSYYLLLWLVVFIMLLDVKRLAYTNDILAPHMLFWAFFVCAFCTAILQYFNNIKEHNIRERFAEEIIQQRDYLMEDVSFRNVSQSIGGDRAIKSFMQAPDKDSRRSINERFEVLYLGGQLNKYQSRIYLFDAAGRSLYNGDTSSYLALVKQMRSAIPTSDSTLYYKEYAQDGHYYLAQIPVYRDNDNTHKLGYVFIDLAVKESTGETVYPELLQPGNVRGSQNTAEYSYAIYANKKLLTQTNDYAFPIFINKKQPKQYTYYDIDGASQLWYRYDKSKTVVVVHVQHTWLEAITLFSYLFGIQVVVVILIILYRSTLSYLAKPKHRGRIVGFTLRRRIHFSMLGIVLVSFLIIGMVTIVYFTIQYEQNTRKKLLVVMQVAERSVMQYLNRQNAFSTPIAFNKATNTADFKYYITNLANAQKIDINVFNASGILNVTSQDNIYDRALLARIMRQDAYYELSVKNTSLLMQEETIGRLNYLSCYIPIRDEAGNALGYINVPYFSSQKELSYQISNILVALINLYAFIFLLSGLITVLITRWITRSFNVVIERFEKLSLTANEPIEWPYDDEIGLLVQEYNKMVKKVEENAIMLAQSEREGAWREMAKQVAHEIKNPLTPMKLNIQYLQQALKNNYPNLRELTIKVSDSLIEQIDNLSYIASEFSNFAKMPEARPENIDVNELVAAATELYLNDENVKVEVSKYAEPMVIHADRNQLLRVYTNLLQNAVQAIPEGVAGHITVSITKEHKSVIVAFADNGSGIDADVIDKIFQPYFTTKTSGTGLGLAMTKKIIEFWKGQIWFETMKGKGTTFFIKMPLI